MEVEAVVVVVGAEVIIAVAPVPEEAVVLEGVVVQAPAEAGEVEVLVKLAGEY